MTRLFPRIRLTWLLALLSLPYGLRALDASVTLAAFITPERPYVEVSVFVVGSTVSYQPVDSLTAQARVDVVILFYRGEEIVQYDKYRLNSPLSGAAPDFMDMKRYGLDPGLYRVEVTLEDVSQPDNRLVYSEMHEVPFESQKLLQSDLLLLSEYYPATEEDPFFRNGYHMEALPFGYYGKYADRLYFYNEVYHADLAIGEDYMVSYSVERPKGDGSFETVLIGHKRRAPEPVGALLLAVDISQLPSGDYQFRVEVRNRNKDLLSFRTRPFQRSNPYLNSTPESIAAADVEESFVNKLSAEDLRYSLKALAPVVGGQENEILNLIIKDDDLSAQRLYLFNYWIKKHPNLPDQAYLAYMEVARAVDEMFRSGMGYGFETDRGHIYMKYGRPDDIIHEENDPSAPPYEIWSYNQFPTTKQANVRFVFYNRTLAPGDYQLLHSTARGEINNPQWQMELYRNAPNQLSDPNFIDNTEMQDNFGRQAGQRFRDF